MKFVYRGILVINGEPDFATNLTCNKGSVILLFYTIFKV